jgi:hypothetical protein
MATTYRVLGQVQGTAAVGTYSTAYTVAAGKSAIISTITICNQAASDMTYRVAVATTASAPATAEFITYGSTCKANDTVCLTLGLTLHAGESVVISSSANTSSFGVFGSEIS